MNMTHLDMHMGKLYTWKGTHSTPFVGDMHCHLLSLCSTPLIKLNRISEETSCNILVKAEHLNPGGSVKDRAALFLIRQAEQTGR